MLHRLFSHAGFPVRRRTFDGGEFRPHDRHQPIDQLPFWRTAFASDSAHGIPRRTGIGLAFSNLNQKGDAFSPFQKKTAFKRAMETKKEHSCSDLPGRGLASVDSRKRRRADRFAPGCALQKLRSLSPDNVAPQIGPSSQKRLKKNHAGILWRSMSILRQRLPSRTMGRVPRFGSRQPKERMSSTSLSTS